MLINPSAFNPSEENRGGVWYYTQNKFGMDWVNKVQNTKGWTVDFNLRVADVQNSEAVIDENTKGHGVGVYVNDGTRQETINFLTQEIFFANADQSIVYDATEENDYRLIGKGDNIKLYGKPVSSSAYSQIADASFLTKATPNGNAHNPSVFEDSNGNVHVVWWDDGGGVGSLFYSMFNGGVWTEPEEVVELDNGVQFPSIIVDTSGTVYVVFESKQADGSVIGLVYKNTIGWSLPYYAGQDIGYCKHPQLIFDSKSDVCVVWEDHRQTHPEIYIDIFLRDQLKWRGEEKLSSNTYGTYRPSLASYLDEIFISWTKMVEDNTSSIEVIKYNANTAVKTSATTISGTTGTADHSSVIANVSGRIFVVWHDDVAGYYQIYAAILSPSLDILTAAAAIVDGFGGARYPVLSEQLASGDVYIVWQDFKSDEYVKYSTPIDPSAAKAFAEQPLDSAIYVAVCKDSVFKASGNGFLDVKLTFRDTRNTYFPATPIFFSGELPILYESYLTDEDSFVTTVDMLAKVKCAFYPLNRDSSEYAVNYGVDPTAPSVDITNRDYTLNKNASPKEIRFGDFSDVLNVHYIFKEIKYYVSDAVEPYDVKEIGINVSGVEDLSAKDAVVNNYGDVWITGPCGLKYYVNRQNRVISLGVNEELPGFIDASGERESDEEMLKTYKSITFDKYNNMYIGGSNGIRYSIEHIEGFSELEGIASSGSITVMIFDKDNILFVGTTTGLTAYSITYDSGVPTATSLSIDGQPSYYITSLDVDANNCLWIGTRNGLYRLYKDKFLYFTTTHGLPSNIVNDVAIRNTAIRYVATSSGISKMVGFNFDAKISSKDDSIWGNNVKSVMWKEPNVLFAGTMSRINQIIINDDDDSYSTVFYEPGAAVSVSPDDFKTYYITGEDVDILSSDIVEVYINGNIVHYGYEIGYNSETIRFEMSLDHNDVVEVVVRSDLEEVSSFAQTQGEKENIGGNIVRIKDIAVDKKTIDGEEVVNLYASTTGNEIEVKINDNDSILPFDKVHLDTLAPTITETGDGIKIWGQLDRSVVRVTVDGATDDQFDDNGLVSVEGSGVDRMIISNYSNFTTNGITSQESVPFSTSVSHDLGISLDDVVKEQSFSKGGSIISYIASENELYAGVSKRAVVYRYDWEDAEWKSLYTYDEDQYIDFIVKYNNKLLVSVGHDINPAKLYTYDYSTSGLIESEILIFTESRAYCAYELDSKLYIGTGMGEGDEYSEGSGNGGVIYVFNDGTVQNIAPTLTKIVENLDENIYDLTNIDGNSNLLAASGPDAYIYEVDIENQAAFIVYNSTESLISLSYFNKDSTDIVFVGGDTNGQIRRSLDNNNTYDISFRTVSAKVSVLKVFPVVISGSTTPSYSSVYAAVGNVIYYLSEAGSWLWKYTHTEDINDITFDENNNTLYVISSTGITKINPTLQTKTVYLKLIDRAGNETVLDTTLDVSDNKFTDSVSISSLVDFVSENQIFELDESGNIIYTLRGDDRFYSADKIEEERGEYISEIFDGTNDLVKWETISWEATQLFNTQVSVYVRTSTSENDILVADWIGPYANSLSSGVDISSLSGQFIQFKVVLTSTEKGVTPSFHSANIKAITSESIHFFTTNFVLPARILKGIITSQKVVPVSADIVFGLNTTNSVDWTEYQPVDENRIFNVNQTGTNMRVGIKLVSPNRSLVTPVVYDEYGPYSSNLFVNTIDFEFGNGTGTTNDYHFRVSLYDDFALTNQVFSASSVGSSDGFSVDGDLIPETGYEIKHGQTVDVLFSVPGSANITCDTYYFVKIEYIYGIGNEFEIFSSENSFVNSCTASFVDTVDFDFTNNEALSNNYHFRIKFYQDLERTSEYTTVFSGNNRNGWFVEDVQIPEDGSLVLSGQTANVVYRPDPSDFVAGTIYYLVIEAHDGSDYVFTSNSYTFQTRDVQSTEYCGGYSDVPIVRNFGVMIELDNNEFVTLNI